MFFIVSKIAWLFFQPSVFLITVTAIGFSLMLTKFRRAGRMIAIAGGVALGLCALTPIGLLLIAPLENQFPVPNLDEIKAPKGIIVLGGTLNPDLTQDRARSPISPGLPIDGPIALCRAGARLTEGLRLALRFPNAQLVFTGGSAALVGNHVLEADVAAEFFRGLGFPKERLTIERRSRTTFENAAFTRLLVNPQRDDKWILVTSASHLPRAVEVFEKAGFNVVPYPVDFSSAGNGSDYWTYTLSPAPSLELLDKAVKEWVGLAAYRLREKFFEPLPASDQR